MSSPLNQQVFQIPRLGQLGMQLDQAQERKRAAAAAAIDKKIEATGADKAYNESIHGLVGDWKGVAEDQYSVYREAAIKYEMTGSDSDRRAMERQAGLLNYALESGTGILQTAGENLSEAKAANFEGYSVTGDEALNAHKNFVYQKIERVATPQGVMVKQGDVLVPFQNSEYFSENLTDVNTFIIPKAIKVGKFAHTANFVDKWDGIIRNSSSEAEAQTRIEKEIDLMFERDSAFAQDVHINYGINARGIGSYDRFEDSDYSEITSSMDDPEINTSALEYYKDAVRRDVSSRFFKPKETEAERGVKATYDVRVLKGEEVTADRVSLPGQPLVGPQQDRVASMKFDLFTGLPSGVIPPVEAEAKELPGGANTSRMVGIGVTDGVPYVKKETYVIRDLGGDIEAQMRGLDPKEVIVEPMTRAEFTRLKGPARSAIIARFQEQGFDLDAWLSGKDVSLREEQAESVGLSDEEYQRILQQAQAG